MYDPEKDSVSFTPLNLTPSDVVKLLESHFLNNMKREYNTYPYRLRQILKFLYHNNISSNFRLADIDSLVENVIRKYGFVNIFSEEVDQPMEDVTEIGETSEDSSDNRPGLSRKTKQREIICFYYKMGRRLSKILGGFSSKDKYMVGYAGLLYEEPVFANPILNPDIFKQKIENVFIYTDLVQDTRIGSQTTNLLEVVSVNSISKPNAVTIYKPLAKKDIYSIEVQLQDAFGLSIPFEIGSHVVLELHIRPS